jgi:hypothetical protein
MSDVKEVRDAKALELLPKLKEELGWGEKGISGVEDEYLLIFLRWKPSVERAAGRYRGFLRWKLENTGLFDRTLRVSEDPELERLLRTEVVVGPPGLLTRRGGALLIGRLRNMDFTDGRTNRDTCRMIFYTLDRTISRAEAQNHGVTILHDLRGFDVAKNARIEVARTVLRGLFGHFPLRVNGIYFWKAPALFRPFFGIASTLAMPKKVRERVHFIDDLTEVESIIDPDSLLTELGGKLEWSSNDWIEENKQQELNGTMKTLTDINP